MAEIKILAVPVQMIPDMWPHVGRFLLMGLRSASDVTLEQVVDDIVKGDDQLWSIFDGGKVAGAFLTAQYVDDDGEPFVGVYALGGRGVERWISDLDRAMNAYGKAVGAPCVRFVGREAWARLLPSCRITRQHENGEAVFERTVQ